MFLLHILPNLYSYNLLNQQTPEAKNQHFDRRAGKFRIKDISNIADFIIAAFLQGIHDNLTGNTNSMPDDLWIC